MLCKVGEIPKPCVLQLTEATCSVGNLVWIKGSDVRASNSIVCNFTHIRWYATLNGHCETRSHHSFHIYMCIPLVCIGENNCNVSIALYTRAEVHKYLIELGNHCPFKLGSCVVKDVLIK